MSWQTSRRPPSSGVALAKRLRLSELQFCKSGDPSSPVFSDSQTARVKGMPARGQEGCSMLRRRPASCASPGLRSGRGRHVNKASQEAVDSRYRKGKSKRQQSKSAEWKRLSGRIAAWPSEVKCDLGLEELRETSPTEAKPRAQRCKRVNAHEVPGECIAQGASSGRRGWDQAGVLRGVPYASRDNGNDN